MPTVHEAVNEGVFVAQDGFNYDDIDGERANQNFKLVPWAPIRSALSLPNPASMGPTLENNEENREAEN